MNLFHAGPELVPPDHILEGRRGIADDRYRCRHNGHSPMRASSSCCIRRRTIGNVHVYLLRGENPALYGQVSVGDGAQGGVVVKSAPRSALEVIEAYLRFQFLVVALDPPSQLDETLWKWWSARRRIEFEN